MGRCVVGHHVVGVASIGLLLRKRVRYAHPEVWQAAKRERGRQGGEAIERAMEKSKANQNISLCFDIMLAWHIMAAGVP